MKTDFKINEKDFNAKQMEQIQEGLKKKLDVSKYADPGFVWEQMRQIKDGLILGLDVSIYAKHEFNIYQMYENFLWP